MLSTKNKKGISLIEAVLTVFVLAIGFMSSMQAIQQIVSSSNFSDREIVAVQLAAGKLEGILADNKFRGFGYIIPANYPDETLTGTYAGYRRKTNIFQVAPGFLNDVAAPGQVLKHIDVKVYYGPNEVDSVTITELVGIR